MTNETEDKAIEVLRQVLDHIHQDPFPPTVDAALIIAKLSQAGLEITPVTKWQDISTAPKDGTMVLLYFEKYGASSGHYSADAFRWFGHAVLNGMAVPTHWQPLPKPPGDE